MRTLTLWRLIAAYMVIRRSAQIQHLIHSPGSWTGAEGRRYDRLRHSETWWRKQEEDD